VFERASPAAALVATALIVLAAACSGGSPTSPSQPGPPRNDGPPPLPPSTGQTVVVAAVGDIGLCGSTAVEQTAHLVDGIDGQVLLAGDLAYSQGSMSDFLRCFDPMWGPFRRRWRPSPGNHEYDTPGAAGYFQYFGASAGSGGRSYYAFRAGDWQVLMLDSNVATGLGSPQYEFVRSELTSTNAPCALAVWHLFAYFPKDLPAKGAQGAGELGRTRFPAPEPGGRTRAHFAASVVAARAAAEEAATPPLNLIQPITGRGHVLWRGGGLHPSLKRAALWAACRSRGLYRPRRQDSSVRPRSGPW